MVNKYEQKAEKEIDLHGYTTDEVRGILDTLLRERKYRHVRIITGKGNHSARGAVLPDFVRGYLNAHNIRYNPSKPAHGGDGALEVFLK
jgi:DNA-nicking Smr family endonuclease